MYSVLEGRSIGFYKQFYVVNLILLLAKFHIHRCKYSNSRPHFLVFVKEFKQYLSLIQLSKKKKP